MKGLSYFWVSLSMVAVVISCTKEVKSIERGSFNYSLTINGMPAGSAKLTKKVENGNHITETTMTISAGTIRNSSFQRVTETSDYRPVKLEVVNKMSDSRTGTGETVKRTATFKGSKVTLESNGYKTENTIKGKFYLDGAFFEDELLKKKFKPGTTIRAKIYEPSVAVERPIVVVFKVVGKEKIKMGNRELELEVIHLKEQIENLKSMDIYVNHKGITQKIVMKMLNNKIEMELKQND